MPIKRDAFFNLLGIAMRAGQLALGESGTLKAISAAEACAVLVDAGASENTKKRFRDSCAFYGVDLFETQADRLGQSIGKPGRMSAAVRRGTLGERLLSLAREGADG